VDGDVDRSNLLPTTERILAGRVNHDDPEQQAQGALQDLATSILRTCHTASERHIPTAGAILKNFRADERETTLLWLFQVCTTVNMQDSVMHSSALLLDRFCAKLPAPIPLEQLQLVTVAIISISLKFHGAVDENSKTPKLQDLLVHLGQHRWTIAQIFQAEHEVLRFLGFAVSSPSAIDFLETFLLPHGMLDESRVSPVRCLAQFLLQLSLLNAPLHYRYSHAVLAAGAVYAALWCSQMSSEYVAALLADVATCCDTKVRNR
jgi:hypothetical protein